MKERWILIRWLLAAIRRAGWAPLALFGFYLLASLVFDAYSSYWWLDIVTHFSGGAALSYFFLDLFGSAEDFVGRIPRPIHIVLAFSCVSSFAIFWEFYEFLCDYFLGTSMQLGLDDTMSDLFFGLLGSAAYLVLYKLQSTVFRSTKRSAAPEGEVR